MEGVPVFGRCRCIDFGFVGVLFEGVGGWVGVGEHGGFNSMFSVRVLCSSVYEDQESFKSPRGLNIKKPIHLLTGGKDSWMGQRTGCSLLLVL